MPSTRIVRGLAEIADRYDAVLSDVWGVIHNGREAFPVACAALARFQRERGPVVLISNAARPSDAAAAQCLELGVPRETWSGYVTSGDVTRVEIAARAGSPCWVIGPDLHDSLYDGLDLRSVGPGEAAFVSCTGLVDDATETPDDYRAALAVAAARKIPFVCANPDKVVRRGDQLIWCAGALADLYRDLGGGPVVIAGKPHAPIYDAALAEAERLLGRPLDRRRVLAIGDGLPTDVAGANAQGLDLLFVAAGIDSQRLMPHGVLDADGLADFMAEAGAEAAYALPELAW